MVGVRYVCQNEIDGRMCKMNISYAQIMYTRMCKMNISYAQIMYTGVSLRSKLR